MGGVEVDYFLRSLFEGEDYGVGREDGEVGVEFLGCVSKNVKRDIMKTR